MPYFYKHYHGLTDFKKSQLDSDRKAVLDALKILDAAQVQQIYDYLRKLNAKQAQELYENGKVNKSEKEKYIKEKTLSKRTIHRHLNFLIKSALIEKHGCMYSITDRVRNDIMYWSHEFGNAILDDLMLSYFPHILRFDENIEQLINIFGIYSVYCLAKATQPPVNNNGDHKKSVDRDSLIISWVDKVFNPQRMLDYFIAIMSSLRPDDYVEHIRNNTFIKSHPKAPDWLLHNTRKRLQQYSNPKDIAWRDDAGLEFSPEDAHAIRTKRFWNLIYSNANSNSEISRESNFMLEDDTIQRITDVLKNKYYYFYEGIRQNTQSGDFIEMTNRNQIAFENRLSAADKLIDNIG